MMSSIRKRFNGIFLIGCLGLLPLCGCELQQRKLAPDALSTAPLTIDPAMQARNWDVSPALYTNDVVMASDNYSPLQPTASPKGAAALTSTLFFLGNTLYTPVGLVRNSPLEYLEWKFVTVDPTYNAMPPLPEGEGPTPVFHYN